MKIQCHMIMKLAGNLKHSNERIHCFLLQELTVVWPGDWGNVLHLEHG